jgi:hypothetical protein
MSFFTAVRDFIFGRSVVHPIFGRLVYDRGGVGLLKSERDLAKSEKTEVPQYKTTGATYVDCWRGETRFCPLGYHVGILLWPAERSGPTPVQCELFCKLERDWAKLQDQIAPQVREIMCTWLKRECESFPIDQERPELFYHDVAKVAGVGIRADAYPEVTVAFEIVPRNDIDLWAMGGHEIVATIRNDEFFVGVEG